LGFTLNAFPTILSGEEERNPIARGIGREQCSLGADTAYNRKNLLVKQERGPVADEEMETYPIDHKGKVYSIITAFDMTFREVRGMLDWLAERNAFLRTPDAEFLGPGKMYTCEVEGVELEVDVQGYEVVVYKRNPA
jgi:hypothetical protein